MIKNMIPKDFQKATANRITELFKSGQNRVLLADEVGLGKTIIASDVIKQVSHWHKTDKNDDHFKVIYVCSNINIANQNAKKLGINDLVDVSESRLSMQHLKIYQNAGKDHEYEQLIPMTPATSFTMIAGCGSQNERALMYAHLKRLDILSNELENLKVFMAYKAEKDWNYFVDRYEMLVLKCDENGSNYLNNINDELSKRLVIYHDFFSDFLNVLTLPQEIRLNKSRGIINELRKIFAEISLDKLEPDLVIMDEFQRFKDLISSESAENEQGMLSSKFLHNDQIKVLLLSATPYKPFSTLAEISEDTNTDHYNEFMELMQFLFHDANILNNFKTIWKEYSSSLCEFNTDKLSVLIANKNKAESALYNGICRTERISTGVIDDSGACEIDITEGDILSYSYMQSVIDEICQNSSNTRYKNVPIDYIKSCPYLISFMDKYKLKNQIFDYKQKYDLASINKTSSKYLLISKNNIQSYSNIASNNARLDNLKDLIFKNNHGIENLLWIPPSKFYYSTNSTFDKNKTASKVLVFSSWEMVPRMISTLISYEAERLTIGKLYNSTKSKRGRGYFASKEERRYGISRLKNETEDIICHPCEFLSRLYVPKEHFNKDIKVIRKELAILVANKIEEIKIKHTLNVGGAISAKHVIDIMKLLDDEQNVNIDAIPDGIIDILVDIAIGSPASCALRLFNYDLDIAKELSKKIFVSMFNKAESSAIIDLLYGKKEDHFYYENVIKYCVDGNLQATLDEYAHILNEDGEKLAKAMIDSFSDTASLQIETKESFMNNEEKARMRTHFAVGYFNTKISDENVQRTEMIRKSFNSPFRPFVLSTTSIGQEGLDFHNYSRKIVHWNLPSNPIDLEQREGRINRFKSLAVRRNIARKYGYENTWEEMFEKAMIHEKGNKSDLVPYWYLPNLDKEAEKIERIVPMYPLSGDIGKYNRLIEVLSLYRLTLGQPRQEELLDILKNEIDDFVDDELFINLSPFSKTQL